MEKLLAAVKKLATADGHDCIIVEEGGGIWRIAITTDEVIDEEDGARANNFTDIDEKDFKSIKDLKATAADVYRKVLA